jgi:hypothetical protein
MVIDMNEERLDSIEQLAQFLDLTAVLSPRVFGGEAERQSHVKRVLKRFVTKLPLGQRTSPRAGFHR